MPCRRRPPVPWRPAIGPGHLRRRLDAAQGHGVALCCAVLPPAQPGHVQRLAVCCAGLLIVLLGDHGIHTLH